MVQHVAALGLLAGIACSSPASTPTPAPADTAPPRQRRHPRRRHLAQRRQPVLLQRQVLLQPPHPRPAHRASASPVAAGQSIAAAPAATTGAAATGDILVFAASSLTESFNEIGMAFQAANPGTRVTFNFAGSNTLAIQLDQGGQADAFASADTIQMGNAQKSGDLTSEPQLFAHNKLTLITPSNNPGNVQQVCDLAKPGLKIVAAQPPCPLANTPTTCWTRPACRTSAAKVFARK